MNVLRQYSSHLSIRSKDKRVHTKASAASLPATDVSADAASSPDPSADNPGSGTLSSNNSSSAASLRANGSRNDPQPLHCPPASTSEYRWRFHPQRRLWWRTVDSMANFILHWQKRFHEHGDMFATCMMHVQPSATGAAAEPCSLSKADLREAVRRLRFDHPTVALRLARRNQEAIEPLTGIPKIVADNVDLQVALVYDLVENEAEVEKWLDDVVVWHDEERPANWQDEFGAFIAKATADGVAGRDRWRVHFWPASGGLDARVLIEQCHSVSEGIGTFIVFDLLLDAIAGVLSDPKPAQLEWGCEVTRLEPALQDAIANPPESWAVSKHELKQVEKINADRMNGKASAPNLVDKIGGKVVALTLDGHASKNKVRSKILNKPLVSVCRSVAESGDMLPLGVLPQTGRPFTGKITHTGMIEERMDAVQTKKLLAVLKKKGITMAPFMEACGCMATMWVRKHRGLVPRSQAKKYNGYDDPDRILGSFSNAISKRETLDARYARYLGLCMSGFPTKVAAGKATLSCPSQASPSATDRPHDPLPAVSAADLETLFHLTADLAAQYKAGRDNPNWLRYDQALMFNTMTTEYLFLRDAAHYPSMPWLSSIGRIDGVFRPSHPLSAPAQAQPTPASLEATQLQCVGRVGIRQPILHVFSFRMSTTFQFSFADWLYTPTTTTPTASKATHTQAKDNQASQTILHFWLKVFRSLIEATLHADDDDANAAA